MNGLARILCGLRGALVVLGMVGMFFGPGAASARDGRRVALVIGNAKYDASGPLSLSTTTNDAKEAADALERLNFKVIRKFDLDWTGFDTALADFQDALSDASVGLVYYAGHALHIGSHNYLMPIGAKLESLRGISFQMMSLENDVIDRALRDVPVKIVILDASHETEVERQFVQKFGQKETGGLSGLGPIPSEEGLLVAYGDAPGLVAKEGTGRDSLFTRMLVRRIGETGLELQSVLERVGKDVLQDSKTRQRPVFSVGPSWPGLTLSPGESDEKVWGDLSSLKDGAKLQDFVTRFPNSPYRSIANERIEALRQAAAREDAAKEQAALERAAMEQAARDLAAREQAARDKAAKEQAAKEQVTRDKAAKDQAAKDQAAKDQAARDQAAKDQAAKDQAAKNQAAKDQAARDQADKDQAAKGQAAKNQAVKDLAEAAARENAVRERTIAESKAKPANNNSTHDLIKDCDGCPQLVVVSKGTVTMGSQVKDLENDEGLPNETPQHGEAIDQSFAVGIYDITIGQFGYFIEKSGYQVKGDCYALENGKPTKRSDRSFKKPGYPVLDNHPVVCVSWDDAIAYVTWLGELTGQKYRLLSEIEFEYLARDGTSFSYGPATRSSDLCTWANGLDVSARGAGIPSDVDYLDCNDGYAYAAPVGTYRPNTFGVYDMLGNVWQWTSDCYSEKFDRQAAKTEGGCQSKVVRGGSWSSSATYLRPAVRAKSLAANRYDDVGFRVARTIKSSN